MAVLKSMKHFAEILNHSIQGDYLNVPLGLMIKRKGKNEEEYKAKRIMKLKMNLSNSNRISVKNKQDKVKLKMPFLNRLVYIV